ncbi:helix-turn-helix transcriptional regulator [Actinomadura sp. WMMB 499]|uniref:helix-turn-helix domain-containing protein n=1 Tax=Actinomadura sp. WMMB 499 TaxID=1219491 RepID=UPI001243B5EE|nr:helix-turn-helix transcriptional regulator [Actinomadura sp. WMMB 499]QFG21491.1 helix-turn-helix domain-containing protein [Actinomadura sp. WMMB 499]
MPIVREPLDPKVSQWHFLAFHLRFLREKAGLSLTQCGRILNVARSTVSNMEAGRLRPHEGHLVKLDEWYGTGELLQTMLWYARMAHDPDWFGQFSTYEQEAVSIRTYHGQAVPHPLQTEAYTRSLLLAGSPKGVDHELQERADRKAAILDREDPPDLWVLLGEGALAQEIGGFKVMADQVRHLLEMVDECLVLLRIVPFSAGGTRGVDGSLQIIRLGTRDVAYVGAQCGGRLIESPGEVREVGDIFERIGAKALPESDSRKVIEQYLGRYA